jgi:SAM-dependent methyltransferase
MYYWQNYINDISKTLPFSGVLLDAGAGDCHWKTYFPNARYISMDLEVGDPNCDYSHLDIRGDLRAIPLEDQSVDVIISIQVLEHLPEPWKVLAEFNRVLKQGGHLFITCPQGEPQHQVPYDFFRYTPFGLKNLLESNGFKVCWIKPQLGNFYKIGNDFSQSVQRLPSVAKNPIQLMYLKLLTFYLRVLWKIHKPLLLNFDQFQQFQDNTTGHFVMACKI